MYHRQFNPLDYFLGQLGQPSYPPYDQTGYGGYPTTPPSGAGQQPGFGPPPSLVPFPGGGQQQGFGGPPSSPPPSFTPQVQEGPSLQAVDPGAFYGCLNKYTYVTLTNRRSFWFYPTYIGRTSVAGWRWYGSYWGYYGMDTRRIRSFQCF
ncbi:transporter [Aeribacillus pallidus]|uniref:transporter n=1 Tax=Aeribacillus pallidus TaxID=33936 RepID=UPI003D20FD44